MYEVYYNMMGVMPVRNFFSTEEEANEFAKKVKSMGFEPEIIEQ